MGCYNCKPIVVTHRLREDRLAADGSLVYIALLLRIVLAIDRKLELSDEGYVGLHEMDLHSYVVVDDKDGFPLDAKALCGLTRQHRNR